MGRTPPFSELFEPRAAGDRDGAPAGAARDAALRRDGGIGGIVDAVRADVEILLRPASTRSCSATRTTGRTGCRPAPKASRCWRGSSTELAPRDRPFGVDFLWDAARALAVAAATGAAFIREVSHGRLRDATWACGSRTPQGCCASGARSAPTTCAVLMNVTPEFASPLGRRSGRRRGALGGGLEPRRRDPRLGADGGRRAPTDAVREAWTRSRARRPCCSTPAPRRRTSPRISPLVDGVIVGSDLKVDGDTWNPVDPERVAASWPRRAAEAGPAMRARPLQLGTVA